ncbi:hypothetical protein C8R44DRAFT_746272 [Mycena epipterygia]|nr:hypothetical protein C8R44DRAFT_746272 [Mycena epipterygia]
MATPAACSRPDSTAFPLFLLLLLLKKRFMSKFAASVDVVMRWEPVEEKMGGPCISGLKASNVYTLQSVQVGDSTRSRRESMLIEGRQLDATQQCKAPGSNFQERIPREENPVMRRPEEPSTTNCRRSLIRFRQVTKGGDRPKKDCKAEAFKLRGQDKNWSLPAAVPKWIIAMAEEGCADGTRALDFIPQTLKNYEHDGRKFWDCSVHVFYSPRHPGTPPPLIHICQAHPQKRVAASPSYSKSLEAEKLKRAESSQLGCLALGAKGLRCGLFPHVPFDDLDESDHFYTFDPNTS